LSGYQAILSASVTKPSKNRFLTITAFFALKRRTNFGVKPWFVIKDSPYFALAYLTGSYKPCILAGKEEVP
jgi:hypothetical protein